MDKKTDMVVYKVVRFKGKVVGFDEPCSRPYKVVWRPFEDVAVDIEFNGVICE